MSFIASYVVVRGQVQGVGYRDWTCATAAAMGLWGWVRNLPDGAVEMVVTGEEVEVAALLDACRQGPPLAVVSEVWSEPLMGEARMPDGAPLSGFLRA